MIDPSGRTRVFAYPAPCDMRKSFNSLSGLVAAMGHELVVGDVFVFVGRTKKRAKVLWYDGTGLCVLAKRLTKGCFAALWTTDSNDVELSINELRLLLEGCTLVGRVQLSPSPIDIAQASRVCTAQFC